VTGSDIDRLARLYVEPTNRCNLDCRTCNSCDLPDINNEDCFGNVHPACGGCLWSQGFVQCP
jgi:hypothetical protein